jgi:hypothetical protein
MWMDESQPPATQTGTAEYEMTLGGRYMAQHYKSEMMGMPFEGVGTGRLRQPPAALLLDLDRQHGHRADDLHGHGQRRRQRDHFQRRDGRPMTGEKDKKFREVVKITGPDAFTFEMFETNQGKEHRVMEIKHTRVP